MTCLAGRLAAGTAAIIAAWTLSGSALAAISPATSTPLPAEDSAPTREAPLPTPLPADPLEQLQQRYIDLYQTYRNAVVRVNVMGPPSTDHPPQIIVWSGFFISHQGDILTVYADKLQNNSLLYVDYQGVRYVADVVGADPVTNVALLHVENPPKNFGVLDLADNPDPPPVGSFVIGITSKQGQSPGPSAGMVQGYNVNFGNAHLPALHLRVNLPDEGGEGGAPVLDLRGRLVGMIIGGLPPDRLSSIVLPTREALRVRDDLQTHGKVAYAEMGFESNEVGDPRTGTVNVVITSVHYDKQSPALAAGIKVGDIIVSIGNQPIHSDMDLRQAWFFSRPGQDVPVVVQRPSPNSDSATFDTLNLTLHLGEMSLEAPPAPAPDDKAKPAATPAAGMDAGAAPQGLDQPISGPPLPVISHPSK